MRRPEEGGSAHSPDPDLYEFTIIKSMKPMAEKFRGSQGSACPGLLPGTRFPGRHLLQSGSEQDALPLTAAKATAAPERSTRAFLPPRIRTLQYGVTRTC